MKKQPFIIWITATLLALLFLYAGASKFLNVKNLRHDMLNQPIPRPLAKVLMWAVPGIEIVIAAILVVELIRESRSLLGLYASFVLMAAFTIYTFLILAKSLAWVPCSCGGVIRMLTWPQHAVFNLFFTAISVVGIWQKKKMNRTHAITPVFFHQKPIT